MSWAAKTYTIVVVVLSNALFGTIRSVTLSLVVL